MKRENEAYLSLTNEIDRYLDKYYLFMVYKGCIALVFMSCLIYGCLLLLEGSFNFSNLGRGVLFFGSLLLLGFVLFKSILIPLLKSKRWIIRMSYKEAASLLVNQVPGIDDQLINAIELNTINNRSVLIDASITQKAYQILQFNFLNALSLQDQKKHFLWLLIILVLAGVCSFNYPNIFVDPVKRIVLFQESFLPPNPYSFVINNNGNLIVLENNSLSIEIKTVGKTIPEQLIIYSDNKRFFPEKKEGKIFSYEFKNVKTNFSFQLKDGRNDIVNYNVTVLPKAKLLMEQKIIDYPSYTGLLSDTFSDLSRVIVPNGSKIYFNLETKNVTSCLVSFLDTSLVFNNKSENINFLYQPKSTQEYTLKVKNSLSNFTDSIKYSIEIEDDQYATINVKELVDSNIVNYKFFLGEIMDDYGFKGLEFVYIKNGEKEITQIPISYQGNNNRSAFSFEFDFKSLSLSPGDKITYYFNVWDNDGVSGSKKTSSLKNVLILPKKEEIRKAKEENRVAQEKAMNSVQNKISLFNEDLKNIKSSLLNKKKMDWNDQNSLQNFLKKQKEIQSELEKLQNQIDKNFSSEIEEKNKEILKKQELLSKMMEELMTDEMKKLYDELNELVKDLNKNKVLEKIDDIEMSQESMLKELDRTIEHFKRLEVEEKAEQIGKDLENLAKKQDSLSQETKDKSVSDFQKNKSQEGVKDEFYKIQNELYELKKKNDELASPKNMETSDKEEDIKNEMNEAMDNLSKNKENKASENQKNASKSMKDLAKQMNSLSQSGNQQQEEDMETLRILLEQLVTFSLDQEQLMTSLKITNPQDPKYIDIGQNQRKLRDELRIIEDSLIALGKRQIMISNKITSEVQQIKRSLKYSIKNMTERKKNEARREQQTVMMHTNELGLLLSEIMQQMQQGMPGSGQCNKPGGKGKSAGKSLPQSAKQLKKQIEAMKKYMEGQKNGKTPGQKGSPFEQLGRMAAEQAAIKKQLMEMAQELNKDGSGKGNGLKDLIKEIEKVEEEIINNNIDLSSVMRQEEIKIKLLELEKATKEQEEDQKREAKEAEDIYKKNNLELYEEYLKIKKGETELLKTIPPNLKPYYKNKVNEYFKNLEKGI